MSASRGIPADFPVLLSDIKGRIQQAQTRAILSANAELVRLYWDIGRIIDLRQKREGWGAAVVPRLARELKNELPEVKGFSERNIDRMIAFHRAYPNPGDFSPQAVAKLPASEKLPQAPTKTQVAPAAPEGAATAPGSLLWTVPWAHHVVLLEKIKDEETRVWYMRQALANGWSRNVLLFMIKSNAHVRQGAAISNFEQILPAPQSDLVQQTLKDPYIFDFLTLEAPFRERELETGMLHHLERFLLELGQGFALVGRQYPVKVGENDYFIDLLFYHLKLHCYVVIDLKAGAFKPEYAGKMNFYLGVVDDQLRDGPDAPSIGLVLCQDRNQIVAEYALRNVNRPIGVSEYELTRALPNSLRSALPTIEEIEAELTASEAPRVTAGANADADAKPETPTTKKQPKKERRR